MIEKFFGSTIRIQRRRKDLRLIISSATVDAEKMAEFFEPNQQVVYSGFVFFFFKEHKHTIDVAD